MLRELINSFPHASPIFRDENKTIFMMVTKAVYGTYVESTIESYSRHKYSRSAFFALIAKHASDTKYRAILKSRSNLLHNIKWNGQNYPLEQYVSNHDTAIDDICDFANHIGNAIPNTTQRVEFLLESITSQDNSLQADMINIRADTNGLRSDFEVSSSRLVEVDPYWRSTKSNPTKPNPGKVSAVTFYRRVKTRVDLRWHTRQEFRDIYCEQKDKLTSCQGSNEGKVYINKQQNINSKKQKIHPDSSDKGNWQNKFKKSIKTKSRQSHVMYIMLEEEANKSYLVAALQPHLPPVPSKNPPLPPPPGIA